jgi:transposase
VHVVEVNRPDRATRRRRGKSDPVDAEAAARAVLAGATLTPKTGDGPAEILRVFKLARDSAVKARTQAINQLRAVLICADPALRESLSGLGRATLIRRCAELPDPDAGPATTLAVVHTLRLLARRIGQLTSEARDLHQRMTRVISAHTPQLLDRPGVGADNAAALLIAAGDNPDRLTSDAAFAAVRRQPGRSLLRQHPPPPTQPRRQPTRQLRPLPHRPHPTPARPPRHRPGGQPQPPPRRYHNKIDNRRKVTHG